MNAPELDERLMRLEALAAFLSAVVGAFGEVEAALLPDKKGWQGFYLLTEELLELTSRTRAELNP